MKQFKRIILLLFVISFSTFLSPTNSQAQTCQKIFQKYRELKTIKRLRLMTFNLENFFFKVGPYANLSDEKFAEVTRGLSPKPEAMIKKIAETIQITKPDILFLQEVGGKETLEYLNTKYLNSEYISFIVEGNDQRQIGYLIRADIPLDIEIETHQNEKWHNPGHNNNEENLFARDLPVMIFRHKNDPRPIFLAAAIHSHSKRDRDNDPKSAQLRKEEIDRTQMILNSYKEKYGENIPLVLAGDFNTNIRPDNELRPILSQLKEAFDILHVPKENRITHLIVKEEDHQLIRRQIDAVMVTPSLAQYIKQAFVYSYKFDATNAPPPIFATESQKNKNPSDHYPVIVDMTTEALFPEAFSP